MTHASVKPALDRIEKKLDDLLGKKSPCGKSVSHEEKMESSEESEES